MVSQEEEMDVEGDDAGEGPSQPPSVRQGWGQQHVAWGVGRGVEADGARHSSNAVPVPASAGVG